MRFLWQILIFCFWLQPLSGQQYDLLIKDGRVIDPRNNVNEVIDIAISSGLIEKIAPEIAAEEAKLVVDATHLLVTPGLIDIHTHVFVGEKENTFAGGFSSVSPDDFSFKAGITTVVDAGTSGWRSFPEFKKKVIDRSQTRVLAFLNISGAGMIGAPEEENLDDMEVAPTVARIKEYPEIIVGTKIGHYRGNNWEPFDLAQAAGAEANVPMILECHLPELPLEQVLNKMRAGDIFTHTYGAVNDRAWLLKKGLVRPEVWEARRKGVYFDVGHGGGSFHYSLAVPALEQGFFPDSFGTDLHRFSMNAGMKDMLNVMSKFLNLGMPLEMIVERATWVPAKMIKRPDLGHISPGAVADVAVFSIQEGNFGFVDSGGFMMSGEKKLQAELTVRNGKIVWDLNGLAAKDFLKTSPH